MICRRARNLVRLAVMAVAVLIGGCDFIDGLAPVSRDVLYCDESTTCGDTALPFCDLPRRTCVAEKPASCATSADCTKDAALPVCGTDHQCRGCMGAADDSECGKHGPGTPRCAPTGGTCVACRPDTQAKDCSGVTPICDAMKSACRACARHAECDTGACLPDGSCAPPGSVVFVDNGGAMPAKCAGAGTHDGTQAHPFCDIQAAVDKKPRYVKVTGSAAAYGPVTVSAGPLSLFGTDPGSTPTAIIQGDNGNEGVNVTSGGVDLSLDGLELRGAGISHFGVLSTPSGGAKLTISRCSIHDNNGGGVSTSGGTVTLDRNQITGNNGGGIAVSGTATYVITNNIIVGNGGQGSSNAAVKLDSSASGTFAFNTVANNTPSIGVGGIDCGSGMSKTIEHSIVSGNSLDNGTQFAGKCTLMNVVTGTDSATGAIQLAPSFEDPKRTDFHLKPNDPANAACCVDKVLSPTTPNHDHDVDGTTRPKGAGWDIGAHEVQ